MEDIRQDLEAIHVDLSVLGGHITTKGKRRNLYENRLKWLEEKVNVNRKIMGR